MKKKDPKDNPKKNTKKEVIKKRPIRRIAKKTDKSETASTKKENGSAKKYNEFKEFQGQKYTGMKVGHGHSWHYDQGDWKETKQTPDLWVFNYNVNKRRAGDAPEGSGVPVGTEYHWYIVAHQNVRKLDANTYSTAMRGYKYKLAHKRSDKDSWSASYAGQRKRLLTFFRAIVHQLEMEEQEEAKSKPKKNKKNNKVQEEIIEEDFL